MFDLIVVTAANAAQAKGYSALLRGRKGFVVVSDPGDRRVGSLGATVNVLQTVPMTASMRVLVCHSGGDARRTPAYAAMGKAFVPLKDGRPLLDHIVEAMERLSARPGVTVCCGDVIPRLDPSKVSFAARGVTGVAYPDGPWQAQRHGVYVEKKGVVTEFLQKPQVSEGTFLIDTGILYINWTTARKMKSLPIAGDIYEEFPKMLLDGFAPFHVSVVPECEFFHIGSSRELLTLLGRQGQLVDGCKAPIARLGGDNIVTNVPASYGPVVLKKGECLTSLPIGKDEWYHLRYRIDDNFKSDGLWERHGLGEKMRSVDHGRLLQVRRGAVTQVRVTAPVRIDFAGGWSDTPPICNVEGGTVVAAAVTLDGRRPIEVTVRQRKDLLVKVVSKDLGKRRFLRSAAEIADHHDPTDWCCLVKAALAVTGYEYGSRGLDIVISADLPKGSGLGTSSILGAATISALLGRTDPAEVGPLTLRLEHEMRTGGGWQDQFAGLLPAMKIMRSKPGARQVVTSEQLPLPEFSARSLLYFTGQKRMARNILRKVLAFYKENPHGFAKILVDSLKANAERCAVALRSGDIDAFADCVNAYWRDKKLLDPGSTNERVDAILEQIAPYVSAATLCGAGGGGFMYILAKSSRDAGRIRRLLTQKPPSKHSRFYDFAVDERGLTIG